MWPSNKKIRVMVVDDSMVARSMLIRVGTVLTLVKGESAICGHPTKKSVSWW